MARPKKIFRYKNGRKSLPEWATEFGLPETTVYARVMKLKWTLHKALTTPVRVKSL